METLKLLKSDKVKKINLVYQNETGLKRKVTVATKYFDFESCFFATEMPIGFKKPKKNIPAEINVYTETGVYVAKVVLKDTTMSLNDLIYEVSSPKAWISKNLRIVGRQILDLQLLIQYADGYSLDVNSYDVSETGVSFMTEKKLPAIYKKMPCQLMVLLPGNIGINMEETAIAFDGICTREKNDNYTQTNFYAYKFINANSKDALTLKEYLKTQDLKYVV